MASEELPPAYASTEDIRRAIDDLSPEDFLKLRKAAGICLSGTTYSDPDELIHEVITRAMRAAQGKKGRRWPLHVPFAAFMIETFRSLADDSRQSVGQRLTDHIEALAGGEGDGGEVLMHHGQFHRDPETAREEEEDEQRRDAAATADVQKIDDYFSDDPDVTLIMMGFKDHMSPAEIMSVGGMTQSQYEAARKRFRRGLQKLFPGGRSK